MFLWCPLWMVILRYLSIRPAWLVVPSTLVSRIGCSRASVWIPSLLVVRWSMKLSIAPLSSSGVSWLGGGALGLGVGGRFVGPFGALSGHMPLDFAMEASSFLLQFFLMFGEGSSGLGRIHFHRDRIVFLFPF